MTPFDAGGAFRPMAGSNDVRFHAIRGAAAAVSASGLGLIVLVISTVMLARLLTPADFGVVTMATTFSLFVASVGLNGLTEAVIQFEEMDHYTASNLFWLNSGAGLVLAVAFVAAGPLLARFYRNSLVSSVAAGLALGILISAASVIHLALLKRAMRFTATSTNEVVGRVVQTVVAIVLASRGWGYWALVAGIVAAQVSVSIGAWWLCRWIPSLPRRTGKTGTAVKFAALVNVQFCLRYSTRNIDNLLAGWRFNAAALGFYKKAFDLFALSASQLTGSLDNVALAGLSRLNQDPPRFRRYFANSLGVIAFVGMAASADLTLVGKSLVFLALGPQWAESGRIFELFGPGIGAMLLGSTIGWIHLSIGKPGRWLRWTLVELAVTTSMFLVALPWGPAGIAAAWSVSSWTLLIPALWYAGRPLGLGVSFFMAVVWRYAGAALLAGLATAAIFRGTTISASPTVAVAALEAVMIISSVFVTLYLSAVVLLHWGCAPLRQFAGLLREAALSRKAPRAA